MYIDVSPPFCVRDYDALSRLVALTLHKDIMRHCAIAIVINRKIIKHLPGCELLSIRPSTTFVAPNRVADSLMWYWP
jgi:hypothetical protein